MKTEKKQPAVSKIKRLTKEIARTRTNELVIVHGGGSYGHPIAKQYDLAGGYKRLSQLDGFCITHKAMTDLNVILLEHLFERGIPAITVAPNSFILTDGGKIIQEDFSLLKRYVKMGFMPILHGDTVLDRTNGFTILSGDKLAVKLAEDLSANRIVFGGDVDGVYTRDPKVSNNARLISTLKVSELEKADIGGATTTDVTGGMMGKIREATGAVDKGIEVMIVNANKPGRVYCALTGKEVRGTRITR